MTSALTRLFGLHNLPLVEDVVGDSLIRALEVWKFSGVPDNPGAWLMATAKNRAVDVLRRERTARRFAPDLEAVLSTEWSLVPAVHDAFCDEAVKNEQLRMMFACCGARLAEEVQVALVLNLLAGFGAREIAQAFLVSDAAMEKRIARGKQTLAQSGALPEVTPERVAEGLPAVHRALYLLFNEGYHGAHAVQTVRVELCAEAIHLTALLASDPAVAGPTTNALLALMCLSAARLPARSDTGGDLVALDAQDRTRWDKQLIARGLVALEDSAIGDELTTYHVEAAIAAEHATSPSRAATNWPRIVSMYGMLMTLAPSPVIALNRAIAIGEAEGPARALEALDRIEDAERLESSPFLAAAIAEQLVRAGRIPEAIARYEEARAKARGPTERRYLDAKIARHRE
jgi:RNA polymerase sigma factor (sigma-70 family)